MLVRGKAILAAASEQLAHRMILHMSLALGVLVYLLVHLFAIAWARDALRARQPTLGQGSKGFRLFLILTLSTTVICVLGALAGWAWLLT